MLNYAGGQRDERIFNSVFRNLDFTSNAIDAFLRTYNEEQPAQWEWLAKPLAYADPYSPKLVVAEMLQHWDPAKAATWESDYADYPSIAFNLGEKYIAAEKMGRC